MSLEKLVQAVLTGALYLEVSLVVLLKITLEVKQVYLQGLMGTLGGLICPCLQLVTFTKKIAMLFLIL